MQSSTNNGGNIDIYAEKDETNITITMCDNGIGIQPEIAARLFDTSQVYTTEGTRGEKGTGLGLLLCKDFVERHGGKIWVESEPEFGSCFRFNLPINKE